MTRLTARYKEEAQFLLAGDLTSFVKGSQSQPDAMILTPPLYYLSSHAPLHFEYRYILPVYFFWFILAGLAIYWIALTVRSLFLVLLPSQRPGHG
ncbi:MAG TPA: hypothetical protein VFT44_01705 [Pyrinomonadaceae bacterium]|nr:hypothetical protein [Pyrinomonadaceae bacterium]